MCLHQCRLLGGFLDSQSWAQHYKMHIQEKIPLLGFSRETVPIRYIHKRKSVMGTEFHNTVMEAEKSQATSLCKLENPESWWYNSAGSDGLWFRGLMVLSLHQVWKPENREHFFVQGQKKMDVSAGAERANSFFLCRFVQLRSSADCVMSTHIGGPSALLRFTYSNVNLFWKHLHRHIQK